MEKKHKIILGIALGVLAIAGTYIAIAKPFKKKTEELPAEEEKPAAEEKAPSSTTTSSAPKKPAVKVNKPAAKPAGFAAPSTSTTSSKPKGSQPVSKSGPPAVGTKLFAFVNMNGYKEPNPTRANIYKYYKKGNYLGTYLGPASGIFSKIIVEETGLLGNKAKTIYVRSTEIYY